LLIIPFWGVLSSATGVKKPPKDFSIEEVLMKLSFEGLTCLTARKEKIRQVFV